MTGKERKVDKLDGAISQIEAASYLFLRDFPPEPIHTLVHAARAVLFDLHTHKPNEFLERWLQSEDDLIKDEFKKDYIKLRNRASNFLKHADQDPNDTLTDVDLHGVNKVEILLCVLSVWSFPGRITQRLIVSLLYFGLTQRHLVSIEGMSGIFEPAGIQISKYLKMSESELRGLCIAAFDFSKL